MTDTIGQVGRDDSLKELAPKLVHEARNILNAMRAQLALLKKKVASNAQGIERHTATLDRLIVDLDSLFHSFLTYARPNRSTLQPVDVCQIASEVLDFVSLDLQQSRVEVVQDISPDVPPVRADRDRLRSVLLNLVLNAKQAMPDGGRLTVRIRPACDEGVLVEVQDTGQGMKKEIQEKIFEPFFSTKPGGTGLGLAIVRQAVDEMGGRIEVQSEEGRGTIFRLWLPVAGQVMTQAAEQPANR